MSQLLLAPAYLRTLLPAYQTLKARGPAAVRTAPSAFSTAALAPAIRVDADVRRTPFDSTSMSGRGVESRLGAAQQPRHRHLTRCALSTIAGRPRTFPGRRGAAPAASPATPCVLAVSPCSPKGRRANRSGPQLIPFTPTPRDRGPCALPCRAGRRRRGGELQGCEGEKLCRQRSWRRRFADSRGTSRGP